METWRAWTRGKSVSMKDSVGDENEVVNNETTGETSRISDVNGGGRGGVGSDGPPDDDCCPICFGSFIVACKANCGHWFCGSCILQYWNYSEASKPCKCPMCLSRITKLTPEASLCNQQEPDVSSVLGNVENYNCLFVGGVRGLVQRARQSPLLVKKMFQHMTDPDRPNTYLHEMRLFAMVLSMIYVASPFNFIPTGNSLAQAIGGMGIVRVFDYAAIILFLLLRLIGICRRWHLRRRVRNLAAVPALDY